MLPWERICECPRCGDRRVRQIDTGVAVIVTCLGCGSIHCARLSATGPMWENPAWSSSGTLN